MRHVALVPLLAAVVWIAATAGTAVAQDGSDAKPKAPAKPSVAEEPEPLAGLQFLGEDTILRPDGWIVVFYRVNFVSPKVLETEIKKWLGDPKATVSVSGAATTASPMSPNKTKVYPKPVSVQNVLRFELPQGNWPDVKRVLEMIDVPDPQVLVEAVVVEITHTDELRIGIDASVSRPVGDTFFRGAVGRFPNLPGAADEGSLTFGTDDKFLKFDYVLQVAKAGGTARVRANPSVVASQGETARVQVADREPIVEQQLRSNTVTATTKFEEVGLTLEVQPLFIGRDHVRARISPELSRLSEFRTTSTGEIEVVNPVISSRSADTVVTVPDGETIAIGGLVAESEISEKLGLPLLMDLPLVGPLFGSTTTRKSSTELVFFITFSIVRPWDSREVAPASTLGETREED